MTLKNIKRLVSYQVQVLLSKMAFELNLKFTERLYLSGVSITSKNWKKDSCRYFVFIKRLRFQVEYCMYEHRLC